MIALLLEILDGLINSRSMHFHQNQVKFRPVQNNILLGIKQGCLKDGVTNFLKDEKLEEGGFINSRLGPIQMQESLEHNHTQ